MTIDSRRSGESPAESPDDQAPNRAHEAEARRRERLAGLWSAANLEGPQGQKMTGADVFRGLRRAVDLLESEQPGGADIRDVVAVFEACARATELLVDAWAQLCESKRTGHP